MKHIQKALLVSLVPILVPSIAIAETRGYDRDVNVLPGAEGHSKSWRASQIMGADVKNAGDETIGDIEDIVVNMTTGEILAVIVSSGGFLGIGDSLSALPVSVLRYDDRAEGFKTKLTKEQLENAPNFKNDAWPDYNDSESQKKLRSYRDSVRDDSTTTDNSTRSDRATRAGATTAGQQGNSAKDDKITKDIRSDIKDTDMSSAAKNIKITCRDERVTLGGEVDSKDEHEKILKIAKRHSKDGKVTDNLTVKSR